MDTRTQGVDPAQLARFKQLATHRWRPQSGIEDSQGFPYPDVPDLAGDRADLEQSISKPLDPGIEIKGWENPYVLNTFPFILPDNVNPVTVVTANKRRAYLLIQNKGPGNIWFNVGQVVSQVNGIQLVQTQVYESLGGGGVDKDGYPITGQFVPRGYVSIITDTAGCVVTVGEGIWTAF